ncbi:MAG: OmpH family outer membrane protein [Candidatus Margulisbacteria bacterium]|nr:OmpH family outer membrane protein [Candidatus Margulisiibacteriota bacterium]
MKKLLVIALAITFIAGIASAANFQNIGFIDVQKVFREYKETESAQKDLAKEEESFKKDFEKSQEKLEKAEKDGKSKEDLDKLRKELEEKLAPKRESLLRLNEQLTAKLQLKILDSVKAVAKKVGIEMVLDKQVIITGGMDLTEMVITELNK